MFCITENVLFRGFGNGKIGVGECDRGFEVLRVFWRVLLIVYGMEKIEGYDFFILMMYFK